MKKAARTAAAKNAAESPPFRLIVHIGAGKTGTSSIQQTLRLARKELRQAGTIYMGKTLEQVPVRKYAWQKPQSGEYFLKLEPAAGKAQILDALKANFAAAALKGCGLAIWSNESFLYRHRSVLPALKELRDGGIEVTIVAYVRRHDAWARSSYLQWGLKHKTRPGPPPRFAEFRKRKAAGFSEALKPWRKEFGDAVIIRNFDAAGDVVRDFLAVAGIAPEKLTIERRNDTPSAEELTLRAVFNEQYRDKVRPDMFDRAIGGDWLRYDRSLDGWLSEMLPSESDLQAVMAEYQDDRAVLDGWLGAAGQPPVDTSPLTFKPIRPDPEKLVVTICQIVVRQAVRIDELSARLEEVEAALGLRRKPEGEAGGQDGAAEHVGDGEG